MERQRFRRFRGAKQLLKGGKVMNELVWLAPIAAVAALVFALILASGVKKQSPGNDRMKEISGAIKEGAQA